MQKYKCKCLLFGLLSLLILSLSACNSGLEKELRGKAEYYLTHLAAKTGIADQFTLDGKKAEIPDKAAGAIFTAHSQTYGKDFAVYVSRDGETVTDTYYALSLQETADKEVEALVREALGEAPFTGTASFKVTASQELSGRAFSSLKEFCEASGSLGPLVIHINNQDKTQLAQEQIDRILLAMQDKGIRGTLYPYAADSVWYEVTTNGIWETVRTGADGGAMLQRGEYTPGKE